MKYHGAISETAWDWKVALAEIGKDISPVVIKIVEFVDGIVKLIAKSPEVQKALIAISTGVGALSAALAAMAIWGWISGVSEVAIVIGVVVAAIVTLIFKIKELTKAWNDSPLSKIMIPFDKVKKLGNYLGEKAVDTVYAAGSLNRDRESGELFKKFLGAFDLLHLAAPQATGGIYGSLASSAAGSVMNNNDITINVTGSNNPEETARHVEDKLRRMLLNTEGQSPLSRK